MANLPKFFLPGHDPLSPLFSNVRLFHFGQVQAYLRQYYLTHFPPDNRSKKSNSGWNRHCNLATRHRLSLHVEKSELREYRERHRGRIADKYEGAWFETDFLEPVDLAQVSKGFRDDLYAVRSESSHRSQFYSPPQFETLTEDAHSTEGRSEFVNSQLTLTSFYIHLALSDQPRLCHIAETWQLLELGDSYDSYLKNYRGDAVAEDADGPLLICSPAIHGWWHGNNVYEAICRFAKTLSGTRCIFLSPLGFRSWKASGPIHYP